MGAGAADGSVVVGWGTSAVGETAFHWTSGGGMVSLGDLPGGIVSSDAHGVSADGSVVVGNSFSASGLQAFRWTSGGGMVGLGDLPGGVFASTAESISADGQVIVGVGNLNEASGTAEAFRWTSAGGMVGLGQLPGGGILSAADDVSADGSVVVGGGLVGSGEVAFLWTSDGGMRNLRDLLIAGGATGLDGWSLTLARAVTPDGRTIVGWGTNPQGQPGAWIATVPEPTGCFLAAATAALTLLRRNRVAIDRPRRQPTLDATREGFL